MLSMCITVNSNQRVSDRTYARPDRALDSNQTSIRARARLYLSQARRVVNLESWTQLARPNRTRPTDRTLDQDLNQALLKALSPLIRINK